MQPVARWLDARAQSRAIAIEFGDERTRYADLAGDVGGRPRGEHRGPDGQVVLAGLS